MGLFSWFSSLANSSSADAAALQPAADTHTEESAVVDGIDFRNAIQIHAKWKLRLRDYVEGKSKEDLRVEVVSRDDECVLGKWLNHEGQTKYGSVKDFQKLVELHRNFHQCAGQVLAHAKSGQQQHAMQMIESGDYAKVSVNVTSQIAQLYCQIKN